MSWGLVASLSVALSCRTAVSGSTSASMAAATSCSSSSARRRAARCVRFRAVERRSAPGVHRSRWLVRARAGGWRACVGTRGRRSSSVGRARTRGKPANQGLGTVFAGGQRAQVGAHVTHRAADAERGPFLGGRVAERVRSVRGRVGRAQRTPVALDQLGGVELGVDHDGCRWFRARAAPGSRGAGCCC